MSSAGTGDPGGFLLEFVYESYAVRAFVGSLVAAGLCAIAVRAKLVRTTRARRLLVLTPVAAAAAAALATVFAAAGEGDAYLPELWIPTSAGRQELLVDLIDEQLWLYLSPLRLVVVLYLLVVSVLVARRALGAFAVRRVLRRGTAPAGEMRCVIDIVRRLAFRSSQRVPRLLLVRRCPGGAFACGWLRPTVAVDPQLVSRLDPGELEGLLAHELAHLGRGDPLLCLCVGLLSDLTFFVPTVRLAGRWLSREQEESADELAARVTHRPVALASSILKVFDGAAASGPRAACAAVPLALRPTLLPRRSARPSGAARSVARRVERLIAGLDPVSRTRRCAEVALAVLVLAVGAVAAVAAPSVLAERLHMRSVSIAYLPAPPATPDESEAFLTFRELSEGASFPTTQTTIEQRAVGCPCIESRADLAAGNTAQGESSSQRLLWRSEGERVHAVRDARTDDIPAAHGLWTHLDDGRQLGVFVLVE